MTGNVDRSVTIRLRVTQAEFDAAMANAGAKVKILGAEVAAAGRNASVAAPQFKPLVDTVTTLGPALIPLAGGLIGAGSAVLGFGASTVLAVKGVKTEMADGTKTGIAYSAGIKTIQGDLAQLERTAARNVLGGFQTSIDKAQQKLPQLDELVAKSSHLLGDTAGHLVGAAAAGLDTFAPLILKAETGVDRLAARFETWASGPGGQQFMDTLSHDMDIAGPAIESLASSTGRLITVIGPAGTEVLELVKGAADLLHLFTDLPAPLLQTGAALAVGAKVGQVLGKVLMTGALAMNEEAVAAQRDAVALGELAGAENAAAGAAARRAEANTAASFSDRASGFGARRLAGLSRVALPALALGFVGNELADATKGWQSSSNDLEMFVGNTLNTAKKLVTFHWGSIGGDIGKSLDVRDQVKRSQNDINAVLKSELAERQLLLAQGGTAYTDYMRLVANANSGSAASKYVTNTVTGAEQRHDAMLSKADQSGNLVGAVQGYADLNAQLQKNIDSEKMWTDTKGQATVKIDGEKFSLKAYQAALQASNGDTGQAIALLRAHSTALGFDQDEQRRNNDEQARLQAFLSGTEARYKLTDDQVMLFARSIGLSTSEIVDHNGHLGAMEKAVGLVSDALVNGDTSLQQWLADINTFDNSEQTATDKAKLLMAALRANMGVTLDLATTNLQAASSAESLANTVVKYRDSISPTGDLLGQLVKTQQGFIVQQPKLTEGGLAVAQALTQQASASISLAGATYQNELHTLGQKRATDDAIATYMGMRTQLKATLTDTLGNADAAQKLTDKYLGIPPDRSTWVKLFGKGDIDGAIASLTTELGKFAQIVATAVAKIGGPAQTQIDDLFTKISALDGKQINVNGTVTWQQSLTGNLTGGKGSGTGNSALDSQLLGNLSNSGNGRATGGMIFGPGSGTSDDVPIMASNGESVNTTASTSKNWSAINAGNHGAKLAVVGHYAGGGLIGHYAGGGPILPSLVTDSGSAGGPSKLLITIDTTDIDKFIRSLKSGASSIASAEKTLVDAVTRAGGGQQLANALAEENRRLLKVADERDRVSDKLSKAEKHLADERKKLLDERASISQAFTGAFDITTAGQSSFGASSVQGIEDSLQKDIANAQLFATQIKKLQSLGLDKNEVKKLAEGGFSQSEAAVLALTGASKADIKQINAGVKLLGGTGNKIGDEVARSLYGAGVDAAKGLVLGLKSQEAALEKQMRHLADVMVNEIRAALGIHSPSTVARELGGHVGTGLALGLVDTEPVVRGAARRVSGAAIDFSAYRPYQPSAQSSPRLDEQAIAFAIAKAIKSLPVDVAGELRVAGGELVAAVGSASSARKA